MPTALITGASSGIGLELASVAARDRHDLVLVSRNRERLESIGRGLAEEYGVRVSVIAKDLAHPEAAAELAAELASRGIPVDVLVNNAGFGVYGFFSETHIEDEIAMIEVNVAALTRLTKAFLLGMLERRRGGILNVASTAAFQPGPIMAVYYATKAYVLSFTEALASETAGSGVRVTALCPGPTRTGFQNRAGFRPIPLLRGPLMGKNAGAVARAGWEGLKKGKRVVVPGFANQLLVQAERVTPRRVVTAIIQRLQTSRGDATPPPESRG
jgi:short-subunit dehydrogenase